MSLTFLSQLTWRDWVTIGSLVFGIVTIIAYYEQHRSARGTRKIAKWAELNLDKAISEQQIKALLLQKEAMEEQITSQIPALARNAILREQAQLHEKAVAEHFAAWQAITLELQSETVLAGLDPRLQQGILEHIVPRYMRLERRDRLRTRVTVLSVALAAFSAILPFPLSSAFGVLLAVPLLYAGARLYALNEEFTRAFTVLRAWFHLGYVALALTLATVGVSLALYSDPRPANDYVGKIFMFAGMLLGAMYLFVRRLIDKCVKQLCSSGTLMRSASRDA